MLSTSAFLVCFLAAIAAIRKAKEGQYEHAITRAAVALLFIVLTIYPEMPVEVSRSANRVLVGLVFLIEIISWSAISYYKRKNKDNAAKK